MDPSRDLGGDRGHVQDQQELGPRSFGQKLMLPQASKVGFIRRPFSAPKQPLIKGNFGGSGQHEFLTK